MGNGSFSTEGVFLLGFCPGNIFSITIAISHHLSRVNAANLSPPMVPGINEFGRHLLQVPGCVFISGVQLFTC